MTSLNRLLRGLDELIDEKTGIITTAYELPPEADAPQFFHYYASTSDTSAFSAQDNFRNNGGVAQTRNLALAKAVGEAIERYSSALYDKEDMPFTTQREAQFHSVNLGDFRFYEKEQYLDPSFLFCEPTKDTMIRWTPTENLVSNEVIYVPGAAVWMPYYYDLGAGEVPIMQPISTGLACHCSYEESILGGLLEVIERDSFSMTWQGRLSWPLIRTESLDAENYNLLTKIEDTGYSVDLVNASTDVGVPVILTIWRAKNSPNPPIVVGASSSLDPTEAVKKSLEEWVHTRRYMREVQDWGEPFIVEKDYSNIHQQIHHLRLWGNYEMLPLADFLTSNEETIDFADIKNHSTGTALGDLHHIINVLDKRGFAALFADLTTPDVASMGLCVTRSLVPGLHPFFIGHENRARCYSRLFSAPQLVGHPPVEVGCDNPVPHLFP